mmetsp:Transcript_18904/g.35437  ORF Transcript_18904/g.35437 Transcript_18904/m.35437 type:complete len:303 (-) Transcript_18904:1047-1955(-)
MEAPHHAIRVPPRPRQVRQELGFVSHPLPLLLRSIGILQQQLSRKLLPSFLPTSLGRLADAFGARASPGGNPCIEGFAQRLLWPLRTPAGLHSCGSQFPQKPGAALGQWPRGVSSGRLLDQLVVDDSRDVRWQATLHRDVPLASSEAQRTSMQTEPRLNDLRQPLRGPLKERHVAGKGGRVQILRVPSNTGSLQTSRHAKLSDMDADLVRSACDNSENEQGERSPFPTSVVPQCSIMSDCAGAPLIVDECPVPLSFPLGAELGLQGTFRLVRRQPSMHQADVVLAPKTCVSLPQQVLQHFRV